MQQLQRAVTLRIFLQRRVRLTVKKIKSSSEGSNGLSVLLSTEVFKTTIWKYSLTYFNPTAQEDIYV